MPLRVPFRTAFMAAITAVVLAGCAEPVKVVAPPPPPAAPGVTLSPRVVELASAYRTYMGRSTAISPLFIDGEGVAQALLTGAAYEPRQLTRGAIAYGAVLALQDKAFVDSVRAYVKDPAQRRQVAYAILADPAYATGFSGAASAAGLIVAGLGGDAQGLYAQGKAVKQSAYDVQRQAWSKADVASREARLAGAKALSTTAMLGDVGETERLSQAALGQAPALAAPPIAAPYSPTVTRALAVAALAALGEAGDANFEQILGLMNEPNIGGCMNTSKLNLYQCLAVARPHYEDVFCLGQHVMMDTGRCVIRAAGLPEPYEARFIPDASSINKGMGRKPAPKTPARKRS